MIEQPQATKQCRKCGETKPLLAYAGRQNTCMSCRDAAKARTLERKETRTFTLPLAEKIVDGVAAGLTFAEICAGASMPTVRQLVAWRRLHPELADAMDACSGSSCLDTLPDRIDGDPKRSAGPEDHGSRRAHDHRC